jgi:hypothetical protein
MRRQLDLVWLRRHKWVAPPGSWWSVREPQAARFSWVSVGLCQLSGTGGFTCIVPLAFHAAVGFIPFL